MQFLNKVVDIPVVVQRHVPMVRWGSEKIGFKLVADCCRLRKRRRRSLTDEDTNGTEGAPPSVPTASSAKQRMRQDPQRNTSSRGTS